MIKQYDMIRTLVPLDGPDVFDDSRIHHLPAGSRGAVVEVWQNGAAYEVEFIIGDPEADFRSVMLTVEKENVEAM